MLKIPVIIDTDPGDDDSTSILWVMACNQFDIKAITVTNGNVGVDKCLINALRTVELGGCTEIPVYKGAYRPMMAEVIDAEWIHGADGLGNVNLPPPKCKPAQGMAAVEMVRIAAESDQPIQILALGPLTNIALAVLLDPDFKNNVKNIVFMGGAFRVSGNETPRSSFNVSCDPEAAQIVYNSGIPVVQVGLDVCDKVTQSVDDLDMIAVTNTPVSRYLMTILNYRRTKAVKIIKDDSGNTVRELKASDQVLTRKAGIGLNDLTTTAFLICPQWFKTEHVTIEIETQGKYTMGETIIDYKGLLGREPNAYFAYDVNERELVDTWVQDMLAFSGVNIDGSSSE